MKAKILIPVIAVIAIGATAAIILSKQKEKDAFDLLTGDYNSDMSDDIESKKASYGEAALMVFDSLSTNWANYAEAKTNPLSVILNEREKRIRPKYLLEADIANSLLDRSQKVRGLAMYVTDRPIHQAYDLSTELIDAAIGKLVVELDFPFDLANFADVETTDSQKIKELYSLCKENGQIDLFWEYNVATMNEIEYIIACDPELYLTKMTEETFSTYNIMWDMLTSSCEECALYDPEMATLNWLLKKDEALLEGETKDVYADKETAKSYYKSAKDKIVAKRNNMLLQDEEF